MDNKDKIKKNYNDLNSKKLTSDNVSDFKQQEYNDMKNKFGNEFDEKYKYRESHLSSVPYCEHTFGYTYRNNGLTEETQLKAIFRNVRYKSAPRAYIPMQEILCAAIEAYFKNRPLQKVNVREFIYFVNSNFKVDIASIDAIDLQVAQTLSQPLDNKNRKQEVLYVHEKPQPRVIEIEKQEPRPDEIYMEMQ